MNKLQKKWIKEGFEAIDKIENAIDTFKNLKEVKEEFVKQEKWEEAYKLKDLEDKFKKELFKFFKIDLK